MAPPIARARLAERPEIVGLLAPVAARTIVA
jgi:hypothetical protein